MSSKPMNFNTVGWVSPLGRNPTNSDATNTIQVITA